MGTRPPASPRRPDHAGASMPIVVTAVSPDTASRQALTEHYEVVIAGTAHDLPDRPIPSFDTVITTLLVNHSEMEVLEHWHARDDGNLVGVLRVEIPLVDELRQVAYVEARIHPDHRRRGVAGAL